ncbi:MAG: hypothetical protein C4524_14020 [Candidatus Zixiibacteriota bacterium]|nr:MAG: hypothetical protein C4524_14020 [candidate division Zixibacteria bacterium]
MLAAACVVLGYLFMPVPNVEMITAAIFLSGLWTGPRHGLIIGLTAEALFSLSNPMGFPPPPLLAAQLAGMGLAGWTGGMLRGLVARLPFYRRPWTGHALLAAVGLFLTLTFDLLTTLSFPLAAGFSLGQVKIALAFGLPFVAVHTGVNTLIFALILPVIIARFPAWRTP